MRCFKVNISFTNSSKFEQISFSYFFIIKIHALGISMINVSKNWFTLKINVEFFNTALSSFVQYG